MNVRSVSLLLVASVVLTGSVLAQHNHNQAAAQPPTGTKLAPTDDMVTECQHHLSRVKDVLVKLDAAVTNVRDADSPTKRHAALDQVSSFADQLKMHLDMCPMVRSESTHEMGDIDSMADDRQQESTKN